MQFVGRVGWPPIRAWLVLKKLLPTGNKYEVPAEHELAIPRITPRKSILQRGRGFTTFPP